MADKRTNNVVIQELMKNLKERLIEFDKNPRKISVTLKEEALDIFEDFSPSQLKKGVEISRKEYDIYLDNLVDKDIKTIDYDMETSYMGFHYYAWKALPMFEKVATVLWFNKLLAQKSQKLSPSIIIDPFMKDSIKHYYDENKKDFVVSINPLELMNKNLLGYQVMEKLSYYNFQDDLNIAVSEFNLGQNKNKFDKLIIANCFNQFRRPAKFQKYLYGEPLTVEEEKDIAVYANQPIELEKRKVFENIDEYMTMCEEVVEIPDGIWQNNKIIQLQDDETLDALFDYHFNQNKQKFYEKLLENELKKIDIQIDTADLER